MREVQKRQLQFGQIPVDKVWLDPKSRDDIPAVLKGLQHLYKEKQEELFMLLEKHILPGTHRGVGRPGMEMWRILVLGSSQAGAGLRFRWRAATAPGGCTILMGCANHARDGAGDTGPQRLRRQDALRASDNCRQRVVDEAGTRLRRWGDWWWRAATRSREKQPGGRLRGRCDSFVGGDRRASYPHRFVFTVRMGCGVLITGDGATGGGTGVGGLALQHRHLRLEAGEGGVQSGALGTARQADAVSKVETYLGLCAWIWSSPGRSGPLKTHWSGPGVEVPARSLDPGLHRPRYDARSTRSTALPAGPSGFLTRRRCSPSSSRTRAGSRRARLPPGGTARVAVCVDQPHTSTSSSSSQPKRLWKE